jgi:uncharacterized tellurite resistance protein B-like protein
MRSQYQWTGQAESKSMKRMWQEFRSKLGMGGDSETDDEQTHVLEYAAAALLLEMCDSDLKRDDHELEAVRKALADTYTLSEEEIDGLIERATREGARQVSFYPHVEVVNEICSPEQKALIVEQLWRIAFADGRLDKYEEHYLRKLCDLIHVPHRTYLQTRHRVEDQSI